MVEVSAELAARLDAEIERGAPEAVAEGVAVTLVIPAAMRSIEPGMLGNSGSGRLRTIPE